MREFHQPNAEQREERGADQGRRDLLLIEDDLEDGAHEHRQRAEESGGGGGRARV